jgi:phospholipid-binding lipoprotein MlaA
MPPSATGFVRHALAVVLLATISGCATTGERNPADPFEPANRGVFRFNDAIDRAAVKPVARAYRDYVPSLMQKGVGNFFNNLSYPGTVINLLLQGKIAEAGEGTARFVLNTTLGWGGIFDVAAGASLPEHDEDLGQTLGKWGVPAGPFLMVPLLGPSSVRDLPSSIATRLLEPLYWFNLGNAKWGAFALNFVDARARLLVLEPTLERVYDRYAFIRDAFLQRRQFQVYDGNPPEEPLDPELQEAIEEADEELPPTP